MEHSVLSKISREKGPSAILVGVINVNAHRHENEFFSLAQ